MFRSVLTVDQGSGCVSQWHRLLSGWADEVLSAEDAASALSVIGRTPPELVMVLGVSRPEATVRFIQNARRLSPETRIVVVSDRASVAEAVLFVRAGAVDYVSGSPDEVVIGGLIDGLEQERASDPARHQRFFSKACPPGVQIVGQSPGIAKCLELVRQISDSGCNPILVLGETGAGKELAVQAAHWWRYFS